MDWQEFLVSQAITTFLMWLKTLKGKKKETAKRQALKVYTAIRAAYADDPDFN